VLLVILNSSGIQFTDGFSDTIQARRTDWVRTSKAKWL
jgi:hypothetical protein